jgi:hypothetical protein
VKPNRVGRSVVARNHQGHQFGATLRAGRSRRSVLRSGSVIGTSMVVVYAPDATTTIYTTAGFAGLSESRWGHQTISKAVVFETLLNLRA